MRHLAVVLSLSILDACATPVALRGTGDTAILSGCRDELPCVEGDGGGGAGGSIALGVGAAALGVGVGALIYQIARWRPAADLRPRS